jgi:hypothetical protein
MYLLVSPYTALKAIDTSVRASPYREIGVKIRVPVFWNIKSKDNAHDFSEIMGYYFTSIPLVNIKQYFLNCSNSQPLN